LKLAADRIRAFHERQRPRDDHFVDAVGVELGSRWTPLAAVGLYVPGGTAAYPSSVLMNAIPAQVAGVLRVVMTVPAPKGQLNPLVLAAAREAGVSSDRLVFARKRDQRLSHLARQRLIDLMLDTYPYNMHSTCRDALWAEVPVLTLSGDAFSSRVAGGLLSACGLSDLIAANERDYVSRAVALATTPGGTSAIKARLRSPRARMALFNTRALARQLEEAFVIMHSRAAAGLPPDHLQIANGRI